MLHNLGSYTIYWGGVVSTKTKTEIINKGNKTEVKQKRTSKLLTCRFIYLLN